MCLQFKGCENVMVSMATLASLAPVRALPCSSFPFTPQAPCPSPTPFLEAPLQEPELVHLPAPPTAAPSFKTSFCFPVWSLTRLTLKSVERRPFSLGAKVNSLSC